MVKSDIISKIIKRLFYSFIVCFLVLRYTPLALILTGLAGSHYGKIIKNATGIHESIIIPSFILTIFSLALYFILFRFWLIQKFISKFKLSTKTKFVLLIVSMFLILLLGLNKYTLYTDEVRDFSIVDIVRTYGIGAYINGIDFPVPDQKINREDQKLLNWAQKFHPPLHYTFATSALSLFDMPHDIRYYRFLFSLFFCIWLFIIVSICLKLKVSTTFLYSFCVVPFVYTYLRNYTFIRCGIEFFAFIGFTTFMLVLYLIYNEHLKSGIFSIILLFASFLIAFWGKFTTILAALSLLCSLAIIIIFRAISDKYKLNVLDYKKHFFSKTLIITLCIVITTIGLYVLLFSNTFMLKQQFKTYAEILSKSLPFTMTLDYQKFSRTSSKADFFISSIFWYSPILILGLIHAAYRLYKHFRLLHKIFAFDCLIFLWVTIGIFGVLCVEPRSTYTSPLTFGAIYLIFRGFELAKNESLARQYFLVCFLFGATEVLLSAFS